MQRRRSCQNSCSFHVYFVPTAVCTRVLYTLIVTVQLSFFSDRLEHRIHPGDTTHDTPHRVKCWVWVPRLKEGNWKNKKFRKRQIGKGRYLEKKENCQQCNWKKRKCFWLIFFVALRNSFIPMINPVQWLCSPLMFLIVEFFTPFIFWLSLSKVGYVNVYCFIKYENA